MDLLKSIWGQPVECVMDNHIYTGVILVHCIKLRLHILPFCFNHCENHHAACSWASQDFRGKQNARSAKRDTPAV